MKNLLKYLCAALALAAVGPVMAADSGTSDAPAGPDAPAADDKSGTPAQPWFGRRAWEGAKGYAATGYEKVGNAGSSILGATRGFGKKSLGGFVAADSDYRDAGKHKWKSKGVSALDTVSIGNIAGVAGTAAHAGLQGRSIRKHGRTMGVNALYNMFDKRGNEKAANVVNSKAFRIAAGIAEVFGIQAAIEFLLKFTLSNGFTPVTSATGYGADTAKAGFEGYRKRAPRWLGGYKAPEAGSDDSKGQPKEEE
jgi:hypothetical protein